MSASLTRFMRTALFTPTSKGWGLPILWWGEPGVGKSSIIEALAERFGFPCEVLSPGERGEGAFGVTPMPDSDGYISYPPPRWTAEMTEERGGIVFCDELPTAPPAIQAPMLGLVLEKRIGGATLHPRVRCMGAGNPPGSGAAGYDLAPPLANRLGHMEWPAPNEEEWSAWLMGEIDEDGGVEDPLALEKYVMANWAAPWAQARALVGAFVRARPALLHKMPPRGHVDAGRAWPSRRSWEAACRAMASGKVHGLSESENDQLVASFVGTGAMSELINYRKEVDLPDPIDVLDGKVKFSPDVKRLDRAYAVLSATTNVVCSVAKDAKAKNEKGFKKNLEKDATFKRRISNLFDILLDTSEKMVDICWAPGKQLAKAGIHDFNDAGSKLMKRLLPLVNDVENK